MLLTIGVVVMMLLGKALVLRKAGEDWWKGFIPVYGDYMLGKVSGNENEKVFLVATVLSTLGSLFLMNSEFVAVPLGMVIVGMLIQCRVLCDLSQAFSMKKGFGVGLLLLPMVFYPILGFNQALYHCNVKAPRNAVPVDAA